MPLPPLPDFGTLTVAEIERLAGDIMPPVERWHPPHCGNSAMRIAADGTWYHEGARIERPELVRLFSRILRREADGGYVLITPHERLTIAVDDAPFVAVELRVDGEAQATRLAFRLNTGDIVIAGVDHPLRVAGDRGHPRPYLAVRNGLDALIGRPVYYQLAELAVERDGQLGVWSGTAFFPLAPT